MRIADADGHLWPHTGHRCSLCRMPADPALDGQPHPGCLPAETLDDDALDSLVQQVVAQLGRRCTDCRKPLPANTGPGVLVHLDCWRKRAPDGAAGRDVRDGGQAAEQNSRQIARNLSHPPPGDRFCGDLTERERTP